jgi:predicted MFS family arabinose efflux permease
VHFQLIQFWHLMVLGLLEGAIFTFNAPTRQAILPHLVDSERLANAIALNASGRNMMRIVGPSLAGVVIGLPMLGISGAFDCVAAAYLVAAILLVRLELVESADVTASPAPARRAVSPADMLSGFRYILGNNKVRLLIVLGFVPILLGNPYQTLLPVFQVRVLDVGPQQLGMLYGAAGVGGLIGTLVVAALAEHPRKASIQLGFGIFYSLGLVCFALFHVFALDLAFLAVVGLAGDGYSTLNSTMVMLNTDKAWYGRVMSIYFMNWSLMPLATLPLGALADYIGAPFTEAMAGSLIFLLVAGVALFLPTWRKMGERPSMV